MSTAASSDEDVREPAGDSQGAIGAMLRNARTRRNLQIEQVAKELHLDARIINAIEHDDQAALPEPIFVQGYLRAYARLVGLPADELVRRYSAQGPTPPPLSVIGPRRKATLLPMPSARLVRNVILVLLAGILVWLSYPLVERFVSTRGSDTEAQQPGVLDLPPVFEDEPRPDSSR
jgi:cytoskeleton protein RodZ